MLEGKAKTDYQREYMRKLRLRGKMLDPPVRPLPFVVHPRIYKDLRHIAPGMEEECVPDYKLDADGNPIYDE